MFSKKGEKKVWFREMIADRKWAERGKCACASAVEGSPVCLSSVALRCASSSFRGENFPKPLPWIIRYQQAVIYENTVKYVEASRQSRRKARLKPLKSSVTVRDRKLSYVFNSVKRELKLWMFDHLCCFCGYNVAYIASPVG